MPECPCELVDALANPRVGNDRGKDESADRSERGLCIGEQAGLAGDAHMTQCQRGNKANERRSGGGVGDRGRQPLRDRWGISPWGCALRAVSLL